MKSLKKITFPLLAILWEMKRPARVIKNYLINSIIDLFLTIGVVLSLIVLIVADVLEMPNLCKRAESLLVFFGGEVSDE